MVGIFNASMFLGRTNQSLFNSPKTLLEVDFFENIIYYNFLRSPVVFTLMMWIICQVNQGAVRDENTPPLRCHWEQRERE